MSRLESMRRRLTAQIDGLNWAIAETAHLDGPMLELGLGNGRTYDHMREYGDGRRILVIDRQLNCHPTCTPPAEDYFEGEADDMLRVMAERGIKVALAHYELGIGIRDQDEVEAERLSPLLVDVMMPGGILVSQQPIVGIPRIAGPDSVKNERYLFYQAPA